MTEQQGIQILVIQNNEQQMNHELDHQMQNLDKLNRRMGTISFSPLHRLIVSIALASDHIQLDYVHMHARQ